MSPPVLDACPPSLTADVPPTPKIPDGAGVPQPVTPEERVAFGFYGNWLGEFGQHDRQMTRRADEGKAWCDKRVTSPAAVKPKRVWWRRF